MRTDPERLLAGLDAALPSDGGFAGEAIRGRVELLKLQFEYAWRAWQYNAQQRMSVFNFFIIIAGAGASLLGVLVKEDEFLGAAAVGLLGALLSAVFLFLDHRNDELIRDSEDLLRELEAKALFREATFAPPRRGRLGPLALPEETPTEDAPTFPLGLRRRAEAEVAARALALTAEKARTRKERVVRWLRSRLGIGLHGRSPYRFAFWLPAVEIAIGAAFLLATCINLVVSVVRSG